MRGLISGELPRYNKIHYESTFKELGEGRCLKNLGLQRAVTTPVKTALDVAPSILQARGGL